MSKYKEFQGKTLDEAIREACEYYGVAREKLEIEILNDAKTGIFGLVGAKKAGIRAARSQVSGNVTALLEENGEKESAVADLSVPAVSESGPEASPSLSGMADRDAASAADRRHEKTDGGNVNRPARGRKNASGRPEADSGRLPVNGPVLPAQENRDDEPSPGNSVDVAGMRTGRAGFAGREKKARGGAAAASQDSDQNNGRGGRPKPQEASREQGARRGDREASRGAADAQTNGAPGRAQAGGQPRHASRPGSRFASRKSQDRHGLPVNENGQNDAAGNETSRDAERRGAVDPLLQDRGGLFSDGMNDTSREDLPEFRLEGCDEAHLFSVVSTAVRRLVEPIVGDAQCSVVISGSRVRVTVDCGEASGLLVGREGQTLASVQYLAARIIAKQLGGALRLQIDAGNYRERQDDRLKDLALALAEKVKATRRAQSTRPLSAYQRRIVHLALEGDATVQTHSKGEGAQRRVIIQLKRSDPRAGGMAEEESEQDEVALRAAAESANDAMLGLIAGNADDEDDDYVENENDNIGNR